MRGRVSLGPPWPLLAIFLHVGASAGPISVYIADLPPEYQQGVAGEGVTLQNLYSFGSVGPIISDKNDPGPLQWGTVWHSLDSWYINQISWSPLRVHDPAAADIIFIPAVLSIHDEDTQNRFIEEAPTLFPLLHEKPHFLVLNHPMHIYVSPTRHLLTHPNSRLLHFVSIGVFARPPAVHYLTLDFSNLVGTPNPSHIHWSRGSPELNGAWNETEVLAAKTRLLTQSFNIRPASHYAKRVKCFEDCMVRPDDCQHFNWTSAEDAAPVWQAMEGAWYTTEPQADFVIRSSFFEAILAGSVPLIFEPDYERHLPFQDVVDYSRVMLLLPAEDDINAVDTLKAQHSPERALDMLHYGHSIRQVMQFMLNPDHELVRFETRDEIDRFDDAFTMTLKGVLRSVCRLDVWAGKVDQCGRTL